MGERLEHALSGLSIFEPLRVDEIGRIAKKFEVVTLEHGSRDFPVSSPRMIVVLDGAIDLDVDLGHATARAHLVHGDTWGEIELVSGHPRKAIAIAEEPATLALLDENGMKSLLDEFPIIALPLASELASYLSQKNDERRRVLELHAEMISGDALKEAVADEKEGIVKRAVRVSKTGPRALFQSLVVRKGAEPPFWMLLGFLSSLTGARVVVALILKYGLEKRLFALVQGTDPNPMHVHHFNYGLILASAAGISAMFPIGRRALRVLAAIFGIGIGLIFDEFALIWNLNPEYAQSLSLISAALVAIAFIQVIWFRRFWIALARRFFVSRRRA